MRKVKEIVFVLLTVGIILTLSACAGSKDYVISGNDTIGYIYDYDKNVDEDVIAATVLERHLPEMSGEVAFARVMILGEADGKTYTLNTYIDYNFDGNEINSIPQYIELGIFDDISDVDYTSVDETEVYMNYVKYVPEEIAETYFSGYAANFNTVTYLWKQLKEEMDADAERYFGLEE